MRKLFVFAVLCAVLFASICDADDKRLIAEQENVIKQTEESRAAADKEASEWEAHIEKLNSEVIPRDRFSHDPTKKAIISHKKSDHHVIAKSNAKQQEPHAKVRIFQHKAEHKAAKYLKHLDHLAEETLPQLHKSSQWHDQTADQMYAHRKAEVDAAFPASWNSAETKKTVVKKPVRVQGNKAWAESVAYRQNQMYKYQADRSKINELKDEMQTKFEHQKAAQQAAKELTHLSSISEEVWPSHDKTKTIKTAAAKAQRAPGSKKSAAAPHAPQQRPRDWRAGSSTVGHAATRNMPMSSDKTIPSAGTDVAYLGAHQAGFARKPPQHAAVAAAAAEATETSKRIKAATGPAVRDIKAEHDAHRHIAAAVEAKPQAKPQAAAAKKAVALPVAAQERKRAMAARAMPQSSDEEVPEMGTNVVFQGASAA